MAAWLLFVLGLWLPSLYFIVFLIVCACTGTPLSDVMQTFIVGMIFSAVVGIAASYFIERYKKERKQVVRKSLRDEKRERKRAAKEAARAAKEAERERENEREEVQTTVQSRNGYDEPPAGLDESFAVGVAEIPVSAPKEPAFDTANSQPPPVKDTRQTYEDETELRRKYFENDGITSYRDYNYDYESAAQKRLKAIREDDERPLVFRSRRDENVFIYEYEDRLQIYRRTRSGDMRLMDIVERRKK